MLFTTTHTMPTFTETEMKDFQDYPIMPPDAFITAEEKMPFLITKVDFEIWDMIGEYKIIAEKRDWDEQLPDTLHDYVTQLRDDGTHGIINYNTILKDRVKFLKFINSSHWVAPKCVGGSLRNAIKNGVFPQSCRNMSYGTFTNFFLTYRNPSDTKIDYFDTVVCPYIFEKMVCGSHIYSSMANFINREIISHDVWDDEDCKKYFKELQTKE